MKDIVEINFYSSKKGTRNKEFEVMDLKNIFCEKYDSMDLLYLSGHKLKRNSLV